MLSSDTLAVIAKVSNLDIQITKVSGCIVSRMQAKKILDVPTSDPASLNLYSLDHIHSRSFQDTRLTAACKPIA